MCSELNVWLLEAALTAALRSGDADAFTKIYDQVITMASTEQVSNLTVNDQSWVPRRLEFFYK